MAIECNELTERANKLGNFIQTEKFVSLDATIKRQLLAQHGAMIAYLYILDERLGYTRWLETQEEQLNADGPHKCDCNPDDCRDCNENCNGCGPTDEGA